MPIRLFENKNGRLIEVQNKALEASSGLWKRIVQTDIDHDGDVDYVVGNAGLNLFWHASADEPLNLYYSDFNNDGRIDPVICNYNQGRSYPVASRDEMLLQMNSLRKKYTDYATYAKATVEDIVGVEGLKRARKYEVNTLQSSVLENLGQGQFKLWPLPQAAQVSCVTGILVGDFNGDTQDDIALAGNFYPFRTEYGPSDAGKGLLLVGNGKGAFEPMGWEQTGFYAAGDVRNMNLLDESRIIAVRNNGSAILFQCESKLHSN
jgi:hypothetical protein